MKINELSRDQIRELKEHILVERLGDVSYGEFLAVDELVSDDDVKAQYGDTEFTADDFFCSVGA